MATVQGCDTRQVEESPSFSFDQIEICYDPFPIGFAAGVISPPYYEQLVDGWPPERLFAHNPGYGNKYNLSENANPELYHAFVQQSQPWSMLHRMIKSPAFIDYVLERLRDYNIDLGYVTEQLSSRFEFSMLSGDGGSMRPHTDAPQKIITLVIYMARPGDWNNAWGGGTSSMKPKDIRRNYNHLNMYLEFDQVDELHAYPFSANGCVIFIKTFNSYHGVYPIHGVPGIPRKSLTINIECVDNVHAAYLQKHRPAFRQ